MPRFEIIIPVEAEAQADVRDLADDAKDGVQSALKQGRYPGVTLCQDGPSVVYRPEAE